MLVLNRYGAHLNQMRDLKKGIVMRISVSYRHGFTLVEIMIVVAIIGLLAAIAVPSYVRAREKAQMTACQSTLQQIDGMKQIWAAENRKVGTDVPTEADIEVYLNKKPSCAGSGTYTIGAVNEKALCSVASHTH